MKSYDVDDVFRCVQTLYIVHDRVDSILHRQYRVNLVALSADNRFQDSEMSNTLLINTGTKYASALLQSGTIDQPQFQVTHA